MREDIRCKALCRRNYTFAEKSTKANKKKKFKQILNAIKKDYMHHWYVLYRFATASICPRVGGLCGSFTVPRREKEREKGGQWGGKRGAARIFTLCPHRRTVSC